jgi:hypothetical protein
MKRAEAVVHSIQTCGKRPTVTKALNTIQEIWYYAWMDQRKYTALSYTTHVMVAKVVLWLGMLTTGRHRSANMYLH